jgi:hypothetical protein
MGGQILLTKDEEKDIAVTLKDTIKLSAQYVRAARMAQTDLCYISHAFHYQDRHVFIQLFKQYVHLHPMFGVQAWLPWTKTYQECLQKI